MSAKRAWLFGWSIAVLGAFVGVACSSRSPAEPSGAAIGGTEAKPGGTSAYQLNLSHIFCVDSGQVEIHFVLLHIPDGSTPGPLTWYNNGVARPPVTTAGKTGNVWHFNVLAPSGTYNVTAATVQVNGVTVNLHNPGEYAGTYLCAPSICDAELKVPPVFAPEGQTTCLPHAIGSESTECGLFGLAPDGSDVGTGGDSQVASKDAFVAILKDGSVGCSPGEVAYTFYSPVTQGQVLNFHSIARVTYCKCPPAANPLAR